MARHDEDDDDLTARLDQLMVDLLVGDESERLEGLRARLASDFVYVGPDAVLDGADGLSETFAAPATTATSPPRCVAPVRSTGTTAGSGSPGREWSAGGPPWKAGPSAPSTTPAPSAA
jgi:hypothetical protein